MKKPKTGTPVRVPVKLKCEPETHAAFATLCAEDGMTVPNGIRILMRWSVMQKTLCPMTKIEASLAMELQSMHKQLTDVLNRVRIAASHAGHADDASHAGDEWKRT